MKFFIMDFFSKCDQIRSLLSQPLFNKVANLKACNSIKNIFFNRTPPVAASERILRKKYSTLREKCRNTEFFLVRIFLYRENTKYGVFSGPYFPVPGNYGPEKVPYLDTFHEMF